jgi:hypothetical protein
MMNDNHYISIIAITAIITLTGCKIDPGQPCILKNTRYGITKTNFIGRWYNYYERALSYKEGQCYSAALSDMNQAIEEKPDENAWAKTYGMHFIPYYPHRERGIIYFLMNESRLVMDAKEFDKARQELELSISQHQTEKAHIWLAKVRQRILELENEQASIPELMIFIDDQHIKIDTPFQTNKTTVNISGYAKDDQYVKHIQMNHLAIFKKGSEKKVNISKTIHLHHGLQEIILMAENLLGGVHTKRITIFADHEGPQIAIKKSSNTLQGLVNDESSVHSIELIVDTHQQKIPFDINGNFSIKISDQMLEKIQILAIDNWGNPSRLIFFLKNLDLYSKAYTASNTSLIMSDIYSPTDPTCMLPQIMLHGWPEKEHVFVDRISFEGQIFSQNQQILSWSVYKNDILYQQEDVSDLPKSAAYSINCHMDIEPGQNRLTFTAMNVKGQKTLQTITVDRHLKQINLPQNRYGLRFCSFDNKNWRTMFGLIQRETIRQFNPIGDILESKKKHILHKDFFQTLKQFNRFRVFEWGDQQANQQSHALLVGDTCEESTGVEVSIRVVSIDNGKILDDITVYSDSKTITGMSQLAEDLANELIKAFPRIEGHIENTIDNDILVCIDHKNQNKNSTYIHLNWPILMFRYMPERFNPITHFSYGCDTDIIAYAKISGAVKQVDHYMASIVFPFLQKPYEILDKVVYQ